MQELLFRNYCSSLLAVSRTYTRNEEDAIEILQDSFLKIFKQIACFDSDESSIYTWMRTIVVRTAIDHLMKRKNAPETMAWEEKHDLCIDVEVLQKMTAQQILRLVQKFPETTRGVFNLFVTEGYTHKEIAEALQIRERTSTWHLSEAGKYLNNVLKEKKMA
jgi:RNA polymerase sigma-70 factor (ECF subfamily)